MAMLPFTQSVAQAQSSLRVPGTHLARLDPDRAGLQICVSSIDMGQPIQQQLQSVHAMQSNSVFSNMGDGMFGHRLSMNGEIVVRSCPAGTLVAPERCETVAAAASLANYEFGQRDPLEFMWQGFFLDPAQWWDYRRSKRSSRHPDFRHKWSKDALWLDSKHKPAWVELQLAVLDAQPTFVTSTLTTGDTEVAMWRRQCEEGRLPDAVEALDFLVQRGSYVDTSLLYRVLRRCLAQKDLVLGRRVHALSVKSGYESDTFLANHILRMYASHGRLEEAMEAFRKVPAPDTYMWVSIISGYAEHGKPNEAINLYRQMRQSTVKPNCYVFVAVLKACAAAVDLGAGREVHTDFMESGVEVDIFIGNSLLNMYAKCGSLTDSRAVFDRLSTKDVVTWNAMIGGYAQQGLGNEALALYECMEQDSRIPADRVTYVCLLQACAGVSALQQGKKLHTEIQQKGLESDVVIGSCLVDMYTKCGSLIEARRVFDSLLTRNVVTWTAMIAGYTEHGLGQEALALYAQMQEDGMTPADHVTFVCLLQACASVGDLHQGKKLHGQIQQSRLDGDVVVGNGLVDMYAKCGSLDDAQKVFDSLPKRDVTTWNALISGYARQGLSQEALALFAKMQQDSMTSPDHVTFICLMNACASAGALRQGKQLHAQIEQTGLDAHVAVGSSLVDMYGKCGSLDNARRVFDRLPVKNVVTWNALLNGYAQHSNGQMALLCFDEMQQQRVKPDDVTFISLLVACSHEGLVHEGQQCFKKMVQDHGITPTVNHFSCMVDLLSRSGCLDEAEDMLHSMPFANDVVGWTALLSACKSHRDVERAKRCFDHLVALEPACANAYVLLGSIYANAGRWSDVDNIESLRKSAGAWKKPAKACIEVMDKVREFTVGEERTDLSSKLRSVNGKLKEQGGHVPQTELVLKPVSHGKKEDALCGHAEKLALAYGLLHTPNGTPLLVTKNLRMCNDCHSSTKIMSSLEKREIVVRDAHRVHRFLDGSCSCGDRH